MPFSRLIQKLQEGFSAPPEKDPQARERHIQLATVALLLEIGHADESLSLEEERRLLEHVRKQFDLDGGQARELLEAAADIREEAIDHYSFTRVLRSAMSLDDRIEVVRTMWRIVYADGSLHQDENHLVRKIAELLGLEHHVMIEAKMAVRRELGHEEV